MGETTRYNDALAFEREGNFSAARRIFHECLSDPTFDEGDLHFHCGWCDENEGDSSQAIEWYSRVAEATRVPDIKLNSYFRAGWMLMHRKEIRKAGEMFRFAVEYAELVHINNQTYRHAIFWFAHCLEAQGQYLEALRWYRIVQGLANDLDPESRMRQILCLVSVGSYEKALNVCETFQAPAPDGFDDQRYRELRSVVERERTKLEQCLKPGDNRVKRTYAVS